MRRFLSFTCSKLLSGIVPVRDASVRTGLQSSRRGDLWLTLRHWRPAYREIGSPWPSFRSRRLVPNFFESKPLSPPVRFPFRAAESNAPLELPCDVPSRSGPLTALTEAGPPPSFPFPFPLVLTTWFLSTTHLVPHNDPLGSTQRPTWFLTTTSCGELSRTTRTPATREPRW